MAGKRKKVEFVVTDAGCHECTSHAVGTSGYPCVWKDGRNQNLHRVLYEEKFGPLGDLVARHTCDNRKCINLSHVVGGTKQDNTDDMVSRGRLNPPIGERSGTCKLTKEQVEQVKESMGSQDSIAKKFSINQSTVARIKSGKRRSKG